MPELKTLLQALAGGCLVGMTYALMAIGFSIVFGVVRIANFAHGHLVVAAGFVTFALFSYRQIHPYVSIIIIIPLFFLVGIAIYKGLFSPILKSPSHIQIALTIALMVLIEHILLLFFGGEMRSTPIRYSYMSFRLGPLSIGIARLIAFFSAAFSVIALHVLLKKTFWGKAIRAAADDREAAQLMGINLERTFMLAMGLSLTYAAIGGTLIMPYTVIQPSTGVDFMIKSVIIVILGGVGSIAGAIIGALIVGIVETIAVTFCVTSPSLAYALSFGILIAMIFLKPSGLFGKSI